MREPAPPYAGEGPHSLWHVSEETDIERFEPRPGRIGDEELDLVWAIDTRHLPLFWFPRDCPRCTFWAGSRTSGEDIDRFLHGDRALRVHAAETGWLQRMRGARVFAYRLPEAGFREHPDTAGYWTSTAPATPLERVELGDLLGRHARSGIELRIVSNLWPLWDRVIASTLEFSGIRLRNALPRPSQVVR